MKEGTQLELERVGTFRGHILCNNGKLYMPGVQLCYSF